MQPSRAAVGVCYPGQPSRHRVAVTKYLLCRSPAPIRSAASRHLRGICGMCCGVSNAVRPSSALTPSMDMVTICRHTIMSVIYCFRPTRVLGGGSWIAVSPPPSLSFPCAIMSKSDFLSWGRRNRTACFPLTPCPSFRAVISDFLRNARQVCPEPCGGCGLEPHRSLLSLAPVCRRYPHGRRGQPNMISHSPPTMPAHRWRLPITKICMIRMQSALCAYQQEGQPFNRHRLR